MHLLPLLLVFLFVQQPSTASADEVLVDTIRVVMGLSRPPYVDEAQRSGFEVEVLRAIFSKMGYRTELIYVPFGRGDTFFEQTDADVLASVSAHRLAGRSLSLPYIRYQDVLITRKSQGLQLTSLFDLAGKSVAAFQMASIIYGADYSLAIEHAKYYVEIPDQMRQVELFWRERIDVLVMDYNIFHHIASMQVENAQSLVDVFEFFPPVDYSVLFKDEALLPLFDAARNRFLLSEGYQQLLGQYQIKNTLPVGEPDPQNGAAR